MNASPDAMLLAKIAMLRYAYKHFHLRYTAAVRSLVWARGGRWEDK